MWRCYALLRGAVRRGPIRWASNGTAAGEAQMEHARAEALRQKDVDEEIILDGENLFRAESKSLLGSYKGRITPATAVYVLHKIRDPLEARFFFDWASKQPGFIHNGDTCAALLAVFLKARLFTSAFTLFTQDLWPLCARSPIAYSTMIQGYSYVGKMEPALSHLQQMEKMGFHVDVALQNVVLKGLCKAGRLNDALQHFTNMEHDGNTDLESYTIIVSHLCSQDRVDKALDVLYGMRSESCRCLPDVSIYNCIIERLCELKMNVAYMLLEQMIDGGCLPNATTFGLLVRGCFRSGMLEEGHQLLQQMVETGCHPDLSTFNAVVEGLCNAGRTDNARQVMDEMSARGCTPNVVTHNIFLTGLCKFDKLDEAQRHVQRMIAIGCHPDASTYRLLIKKLCKEGKAMEAHRFFKEMVGRGCEPDSSIYNMLLTGHCKSSKATAGYGLFRQMVDKGIVPDATVCLSLVQLLQKSHRFAEAKDVARAIADTPQLLC